MPDPVFRRLVDVDAAVLLLVGRRTFNVPVVPVVVVVVAVTPWLGTIFEHLDVVSAVLDHETRVFESRSLLNFLLRLRPEDFFVEADDDLDLAVVVNCFSRDCCENSANFISRLRFSKYSCCSRSISLLSKSLFSRVISASISSSSVTEIRNDTVS